MADIAFLLLIFFLVTTTIQQPEAGQPDTLPYESPFKPPPTLLLQQNFLRVKANQKDQLLIREDRVLSADQVDELYEITKTFFGSHERSSEIDEDGDGKLDYPVRLEVTMAEIIKDIDNWQSKFDEREAAGVVGDELKFYEAMLNRAKKKQDVFKTIGKYYELPKMAIIKFESDPGTSYGFYIAVLDQMKSALNDLRNEYSQDSYGVNFDELDVNDDADKINIIETLYPDKIMDSSNKNYSE